MKKIRFEDDFAVGCFSSGARPRRACECGPGIAADGALMEFGTSKGSPWESAAEYAMRFPEEISLHSRRFCTCPCLVLVLLLLLPFPCFAFPFGLRGAGER